MNFSQPEMHIESLGLNPGNIVVDFGAGTGAYAKLAAQEVTSRGIVYAVDIHKDLLTRLKKDALEEGIHNIEIVWGDIEVKNGVQLQDHIADAVILSNTLFMISNKETLMQEIKRILKSGGKVLVVEWTDSHDGIGPHKDHVVQESDAHTLFAENNFTISHISDQNPYHYRFVATYTL